MDTRELKGQTSLEEAVLVLRRRWWLVLLCVVVAGGAAFGFSSEQQKKYTASSQILFQDQNFSQQLFGSNFINPNVDPVAQQATNISLASLPAVAARTAGSLHIPAGLVASEVSVSSVGQSNLASVNATDPRPARAAKIANAYARQYVVFRQQADRAAILTALRQVNRQLAKLAAGARTGTVGQELQTRANDLGVLASLQTGDVQVAQLASVPTSPSSPKTKRNAALGALLGLLLGLGLAFLLQRLDRRVREPRELEEIYGVPMLAAVPESRALAAKRVALLPTADLDAIALLRTRLRYFNVDRNVRSLLITSAAPSEGKSTIAINLAIVEALSGDRSVVLFEADLRRPSAAKRLGLSSTPGTSEILSGNASLDGSLVSVEVPHRNGRHSEARLAVLPSGAIPPNPIELLSSHALIHLLNELTERFDLVVIDSPPLTLVSDAIPVVQCVSGVLVVARIGLVTRSAARHAAEQLENLNAPTLGVVANVMPRRDQAYYFGYGYEYRSKGIRRRGRTPVGAATPASEPATHYPESEWTEPTIDPD
jgi:capsular exopolysaccharide synthesis family protein